MKNIFEIIFLVCFTFLIIGCPKRMAIVDGRWIVDKEIESSSIKPATLSFRVSDRGQTIYSGHPSKLAYGVHAIMVDLESIQKIAGKKVLDKYYESVVDTPNIHEIVSYVTDFRYNFWAHEFTGNPPAFVSFKLHVDGIRNGQTLMSQVFEIRNFEGRDGLHLSDNGWTLVPCIGIMFFKDFSGNMPEVVAIATMDAVYETYKRELPQIASMIIQEKEAVYELPMQENEELDKRIDGFHGKEGTSKE